MLDAYESERVEWLAEIENLSSKLDDTQRKEQEILIRKKEIAELQKAISDSHLAIYEEKNTVNGLRLQYEDLLKIEKTDMRRINELKSLN